MTTVITESRNPLDLPELRQKVCQYITIKDAFSCIIVCKAWTADFIPIIWHLVDLVEQPNFVNLSPDIISKYGCHIKIIDTINNIEGASLINNPAINNLKELAVHTNDSIEYNTHLYEIVHRNVHGLRQFYIDYFYDHTGRSSLVKSPMFVPNTSQGITKNLTNLIIKCATVTLSDLVTTLMACPMLESLAFSTLWLEEITDVPFKHTNVKRLHIYLNCLLFQGKQEGPSLLSYFPNLTFLNIRFFGGYSYLPIAQLKTAIAENCPKLTEVDLKGEDGFVVDLCTHVFKNLTLIHFSENISIQIMDSILLHQNTLKDLSIFEDEGNFQSTTDDIDGIDIVPCFIQEFAHILQRIPRSCPKLESLSLHLWEMEMDDIEGGEWICKDLRKLQIRVKGLDTKKKIRRVIEMWRSGSRERWRKEAIESKKTMAIEKDCTKEEKQGVKKDEGSNEHEDIDTSIEARVARHLLKFEKLKTVWLGCQTWTLV
ncbi:hypothetical protein FBU30_007804 [Linnemannia zychae]|nr:hypothetical protein FBU30_007804 [Linnemannia zychae]